MQNFKLLLSVAFIAIVALYLSACSTISTAPLDTPTLKVNELPKLSNTIAQRQFEEWKNKPKPRAFAVSDTGFWWFTWNTPNTDKNLPANPADRAIFVCEQKSGVRCHLYAVDDEIVWKP